MILKNLLLKLRYPNLKFIDNLFPNFGIYTNSNIDIVLLHTLWHSFANETNTLIVEINKPLDSIYSVSNVFIKTFSSDLIMINTKQSLILTQFKNTFDNDGLSSFIEIKSNELLKSLSVNNRHNPKVFQYSNTDRLESFLNLTAKKINLLICDENKDSINILNKFLMNSSINYIYLHGNNKIKLGNGDENLRSLILKKGYVFYARINSKDDLYVLSEFINGFPSSSFETINTLKLQKLISLPINSDFTKPS